jgi:hypothetical protein
MRGNRMSRESGYRFSGEDMRLKLVTIRTLLTGVYASPIHED